MQCSKDNAVFEHSLPYSANSKEILNISYHTRILLLTALDRFQSAEEAAKKLGVSTRTIYNYKQIFGISRNEITNRYQLDWNPAPGFRMELVAPLLQLPANNMWAECLQLFAQEALSLSESQFLSRVREIQDQIRSCPDTMKGLLGDHFILFKLLNAYSA